MDLNINSKQINQQNIAENLTVNSQEVTDSNNIDKLIEALLLCSERLPVSAKSIAHEDILEISELVKVEMGKAAELGEEDKKKCVSDTLTKVNETMGGTATLLKNLLQLASLLGIG